MTAAFGATAPWAHGLLTRGVNRPANIAQVPVDFVERVLTRDLWDAFTSGTAFTAQGRQVSQEVWTVPLTVADGPGAGKWRAFSARLRQRAARAQVVQLVDKDPVASRESFQRAAGVLRGGARPALVEWPVNAAMLEQAARAWPGAEHVDIVGISIAPGASWSRDLEVLTSWREWAADQGKRVSVHWYIGPDTTPAQVRNMHDWLLLAHDQHALAYESVDATRADAAAQATYRQLWSQR